MNIYQLLRTLGIPVAYGRFKETQVPPYIVYIGGGQDKFDADDTIYARENNYQIEYYFTKKNEAKEAEIEQLLIDNDLSFTKSEDVYIADDDIFLIYYII